MQSKPTQADTIYIHGNIYTGISGASSFHELRRVEAIAVKGDRILGIGSEGDIRKSKVPETVVVDLAGRFVMPGFNDAHLHLTDAGLRKLTVDLTGVRSVEEFRERIRKRAESLGRGEWITGSGWDETLWRGKELPTRWDVDQATTDHPVYVERIDGHVAVANTLALKMARVTLATKDLAGGEIGRDAGGQPNGILRETARSLVTNIIPAPTADKRRRAIEAAFAEFARAGVTSVQDYSDPGSMEANWADFQLFEQLEKEGKLTVRICEWMPFDAPPEVLKQHRAAHPQSDLWLHTGMLKAFMDGSLGSHTASLLEPYADEPQNSGIPRYEPAKLNDMAAARLAAGFQLGFHAIGDKAVQMALDAFEAAEKIAGESDIRAADGSMNFRLRIEHAQVTNSTEVARFRELKVIASMQPNHLLTDMRWAKSRLGRSRAAHSYAWAEFLNHGVILAFGTDYPVEPVDPWRGLYAAVTRKSEDGKQEYVPEQKLTIEQAIAAYTTGSAYAEFADKDKGTLAPGMLADFVVLDRDLTAIAPEKILGTQVLRTVVGGKTVYEAKEKPQPFPPPAGREQSPRHNPRGSSSHCDGLASPPAPHRLGDSCGRKVRKSFLRKAEKTAGPAFGGRITRS
jgi:predicted amidohydrolase YtcJ